MNNNSKFLEVLSSPNARISLILIVLGVLGSIGVIVDTNNDGIVNEADATNIMVNTFGNNLTALINYLVPILVGIIPKILEAIKLKTFSFSYFITPNFITLAFSLVSLVIGAYLNASVAGLVVTLIANILNFIYHINLPVKYGTDNSTK